MINYYAGLALNVISGITIEHTAQFFLTGSDICAQRGVREIFCKKLGRDVEILDSGSLNLTGCGNYIASYFEREGEQENYEGNIFAKLKGKRRK